jgi:hypothetical protein
MTRSVPPRHLWEEVRNGRPAPDRRTEPPWVPSSARWQLRVADTSVKILPITAAIADDQVQATEAEQHDTNCTRAPTLECSNPRRRRARERAYRAAIPVDSRTAAVAHTHTTGNDGGLTVSTRAAPVALVS